MDSLVDSQSESFFSRRRAASISSSSFGTCTADSSFGDDIPDVYHQLRSLHADELVNLSRRPPLLSRRSEQPFSIAFTSYLVSYFKFQFHSWRECVKAIRYSQSGFENTLLFLVFTCASSLITSLLLIWCIFARIPQIRRAFQVFSQSLGDNVSLVNSAYPYLLNESTAKETMIAARRALHTPQKPSSELPELTINLNVAKLLLTCSAIMYERPEEPLNVALATLRNRPDVSESDTMPALVGPEAVHVISASLHMHESNLATLASRIGLEYTTISELNTEGSPFCGLFWDPNDTFIIAAFRGTSPSDFDEWTTDFSFQPRNISDLIKGWGSVHGGFADKVFPQTVDHNSRSPYETIILSIRILAYHLLRGKSPVARVNVWTTGHSLGAALASLTYARQISDSYGLGDRIDMRDAYLFGTPVTCDSHSMHAFSRTLRRVHNGMMWRITNGDDIVATGVPNYGDRLEIADSESFELPFSFAHLGPELKLGKIPVVSSGPIQPPLFSRDRPIRIEAVTIQNGSHGLRERLSRLWFKLMHMFPLLGPFVDHSIASYWLQLECTKTEDYVLG